MNYVIILVAFVYIAFLPIAAIQANDNYRMRPSRKTALYLLLFWLYPFLVVKRSVSFLCKLSRTVVRG